MKDLVQSATFSSKKNRMDKAKSELDEFGEEIKAFLKEQGVDVQVAAAAVPVDPPSSDSSSSSGGAGGGGGQ